MNVNHFFRWQYETVIEGLEKDEDGAYRMYNSRVPDKKVVVTKIWRDGIKHSVDDLDITISTEKPQAAATSVKLTLDLNGGTVDGSGDDIRLVFAKKGDKTTVAGTYAQPANDEKGDFVGWTSTKDSSTITVAASDIKPDDLSALSNQGSANGSTLWAKYARYAYAVQLYGICVDTLEGGKTGGLTFGPATGKNYTTAENTKDYNTHQPAEGDLTESHTVDGKTFGGNQKRCIHADDWETIISWNSTDPYVYEDCIEKNCTQSVRLKLTGKEIFNVSDKHSVTGDGAGNLRSEIANNYERYADKIPSDSGLPLSVKDNTSGGFVTVFYLGYYSYLNWANSKIRAVLNGAQNETGKIYINGNFTDGSSVTLSGYGNTYTVDIDYGGSDIDDKNSLLSAFPEVLQNAIGKKAVEYGLVFDGVGTSNIGTCYDKLWLFSAVEVGGYSKSTSGSSYSYLMEGSKYEKFTSVDPYSEFNRRTYYSGYDGWGTYSRWWLRSRVPYHEGYLSYLITFNGDVTDIQYDGSVKDDIPSAPGFVLAR